MENNRPQIAPAEETSLTVGAKVLVYTMGGAFETEVLQLMRQRVYLGPPPRGKVVRLQYDQAACAARTFSDGRMLMTLLRYQERGRSARGEQDLYWQVPGGQVRLWPGLSRLAMHDWCSIRVFEVHRPEQVLAAEEAFLFALSPDTVEMLVAKMLPLGAFAQCSLKLGEHTLETRMVLTKAEKLEDDPFCRAEFSFVDPGISPRIERYLMEERARRMYMAGI